MITIKSMFGDNIVVEPTRFPDGTQQVWKLGLIPSEIKTTRVVHWEYENENEAITIMQLGYLIKTLGIKVEMVVPYLPYGRQDKEVSDSATFGKIILEDVFRNYDKIITTDVHSLYGCDAIDKKIHTTSVTSRYYKAMRLIDVNNTAIVYPDFGASKRYERPFPVCPLVTMKKVRDQLTGKISLIKVDSIEPAALNMKNFLIVDDISDYGGTFKGVAAGIKAEFPDAHVHLYVTHFLGHGGMKHLHDAGIEKIFTTDSLDAYRKNNERLLNETYEDLIIV